MKKIIVNKEYTTLLRNKRFKIMGGFACRLPCKQKSTYPKFLGDRKSVV